MQIGGLLNKAVQKAPKRGEDEEMFECDLLAAGSVLISKKSFRGGRKPSYLQLVVRWQVTPPI